MEEYLTCTVKLSKEDLGEWLIGMDICDEEEVENMSNDELQSKATMALEGILSDHFSDYYVLDKDSIVVGSLKL